jgi:uncharacterized protein (DUF983 family)
MRKSQEKSGILTTMMKSMFGKFKIGETRHRLGDSPYMGSVPVYGESTYVYTYIYIYIHINIHTYIHIVVVVVVIVLLVLVLLVIVLVMSGRISGSYWCFYY